MYRQYHFDEKNGYQYLYKKIMKFLTILVLNIFDYFHKKKIVKFLIKNNLSINIIFDIGGHRGESLKLFTKYLNVKKIYSFEPIAENFTHLTAVANRLRVNHNVEIITEKCAFGNIEKNILINKFLETSSSTIKKVNYNSKYFKKKNFFLNIKKKITKENIRIIMPSSYMERNRIKKIDFLKIDTEGFEYDILLGFKENIKNVGFVLFEHHYDDMIEKNYNFSNINNLLVQYNFVKVFKIKMFFRKTFEYIYLNKNFYETKNI